MGKSKKTKITIHGQRECDAPQGPNRHKRNGAGFHEDKRTKRKRTRQAQKQEWQDG